MRLDPKNRAYNKYAEPRRFENMTAVDKAAGITLFFIAAVIPLIVKYAEVPVGPDQNMYSATTETTVDMFSYYKSIFILIGSGILTLCLIAYTLSERLKFLFNWRKLLTHPLFIAFAVFILAVIASSLNSAYGHTVSHGMSERYESAFILLGYFVIFASALIFTRGEYQLRFLIYGILFSCFIISLIGAFQCFDMDFFMTDIARRLVISFDTNLRLTSPFTAQHLSYSTLYNPNSVGAYTALILPVTVVGAVHYKRNPVIQVWFGVCAVLTLITAIGCNSSGGLAGLGVAAFVLLIITACLAFKGGFKISARVRVGVLAVLILAAAAGLGYSPMRERLHSMLTKLLNPGTGDSGYFFKDLSVDGDTAEIVTQAGSVFFTRIPGSIEVSIGGDPPVLPVSSQHVEQNNSVSYNYSVSGFGDFVLETVEGFFLFSMNSMRFMFGYDENNNIFPLSNRLRVIDLSKPVPAFGLEGRELWGSGRGYMWSRTIPLLKQSLILGSGPDTYALTFPQDDIVGKVRYLGNPYIVVDKPHNFFLMTGIDTGVVSMAAMIFIFAWYIITSSISILKGAASNEEKWMFWLRIAILSGVCGYAVASMSTDSTVSVSPLFWLILGIGTALQRRLLRE
ncbi:MAG: O-antigen ligase family protein [Clostridiales bacterium]|jgi:hypothetical protein|nr:O-antigen ligase family protein [Clostridiales bacterium]